MFSLVFYAIDSMFNTCPFLEESKRLLFLDAAPGVYEV